MLKIIFDTNIFVSTFLFRISMLLVVEQAFKKHRVCFSQDLIDEVKEKCIKKFLVNENILQNFEVVLEHGELYHPIQTVTECKDPDDNFLLELAQESEADLLVSGDKAVLALKRWKTTKIITTAQLRKVILK